MSIPRLSVSSSKPDYVVYPIIPEINITHNDNISLFASSGDGLSPETAYIIENFTIYNSNTTSIHVFNTSRFLRIRNFQVFHNLSSYLINITDCINISFENGTLPNIYDEKTMARTNYGFYVKNSSVQITDLEIHNCDRQYFRDVYHSFMDKLLIFNYFYSDTSLWLISCDSINITNCAINDGIIQWSESAIRLWSSDTIRIINCYFWHQELYASYCKSVYFMDNYLIMEEDGLRFYDCENLILRNNSGWADEYFLALSNSNNTLCEENSIFQNRSHLPFMLISNSQDSMIRNNDILTNSDFLSIGVCSNITIIQNLIECNGEVILYFPEDENFKQTNFDFKNNKISGSFTSLSNRIGYVPNIFQLFTCRIPFNSLILIFTVSVGVFSIIGIVFSNNKRVVTYYTRKTRNNNLSDSETDTIPFWVFPFVSSLFCFLFTFPTIYKVELFDYFISILEFPIAPYFFNYVIMLFIWGVGLISVTFVMVKRQLEINKKLDRTVKAVKADKLLWVKIFVVIVCIGFFSYLLHYILLIYSATVSFVYIAIMVIIIALSSRNSFKVFGVKPIYLILLSFLLLLDFGISTTLLFTRIRFFEMKWFFALLPRSIYLFMFLSFIKSKIDDHLTKINQETVVRSTEDLTEDKEKKKWEV